MLKMSFAASPDRLLVRRFILPGLLIVAVQYGLLTTTPFFVLGLHTEPVNLVMGGAFDPKGLPGLHPLVYTAGFLLILIAPIMLTILGSLLLIHARQCWSLMSRAERWQIARVGLGSLALLLFMFTSPLAHLITTWWLD